MTLTRIYIWVAITCFCFLISYHTWPTCSLRAAFPIMVADVPYFSTSSKTIPYPATRKGLGQNLHCDDEHRTAEWSGALCIRD